MSSSPPPPELLTLAVGRHRAGALHEAQSLYRQYLARFPDDAAALQLLGVLSHQLGRNDEAVELLSKAISLNPSAPEYHVNLGAVLAARQDWERAIAAFGSAIALRPHLPEAHHNLGKALRELGKLEEAIASFRETIRLRPDHADAWHDLADALQQSGRAPEAVEAYEKALIAKPQNPQLLNNLGNAYRAARHLEKAVQSYRTAIALKPDSPQTLNNLALALQDLGALDEAIATSRRSLELRPDDPGAISNLANALINSGRLDEAIDLCRQVLSARPEFSVVRRNLGWALRESGQVPLAIESFREGLRIRSDPTLYSDLLFSLHFDSTYDRRRLFEEHSRWFELHARPLDDAVRPHQNDRSPRRPLRIGYVAHDPGNNPLGRFFLPLLTNHDHAQIQTFCYCDSWLDDAVGRDLRGHAGTYRDTRMSSDPQVAELVRQDRIDVLVDLNLHTNGNRLLAFARKPAPVQVSYLAYCSTTGLKAIDYRLSDPYLDPVEWDDSLYTERTFRLGRYWCYPAPPEAPPVGPLPAKRNGYITFGSLNDFAKTSPQLIAAWAALLRQVTDARLVLHAKPGHHRQVLLDDLARLGVSPSRVNFVGRLPLEEYFAQYNRIDIGLDAFAWSGGITTCDALWMGVPVVSLAGDRSVSRGGLSILSVAGLPELAAGTVEQYVQTVVALANDLPRLTSLRSSLRQRMHLSPLMDGVGFARQVEAAYRQMWREYCAGTATKRNTGDNSAL